MLSHARGKKQHVFCFFSVFSLLKNVRGGVCFNRTSLNFVKSSGFVWWYAQNTVYLYINFNHNLTCILSVFTFGQTLTETLNRSILQTTICIFAITIHALIWR